MNECPVSPNGRHQVDTSYEAGLHNCFHCERPMPKAVSVSGARESRGEGKMKDLLSNRAERIAFATSEPASHATTRPARWTELLVYYDHQSRIPGKPWIAISRGVSTHPGETTKEEAVQVGSLDRALKLFREDSQLGRSVIAQAKDWDESRIMAAHHEDVAQIKAGRFDGETQEEALRWLYGDELDEAKPATLLARDFGAGESTVRAALAADREIKVPLLAAVRFIDRDAFRRARNGGGNG